MSNVMDPTLAQLISHINEIERRLYDVAQRNTELEAENAALKAQMPRKRKEPPAVPPELR